jgi:hypothetical protein
MTVYSVYQCENRGNYSMEQYLIQEDQSGKGEKNIYLDSVRVTLAEIRSEYSNEDLV